MVNAMPGHFVRLTLASPLRITLHQTNVRIGEDDMRRSTWLLIGAILIGIAIFLYIVFCPTDCH
jgi:hypothetical protein